MKNKEIEELLNNLYRYKSEDNKCYPNDILTIDDVWLLLSHIEQVVKENKILRENAEHNDKVVDKVNWENNLLKKENQQLKKSIKLFADDLANMTNKALELKKQKDDVVELIKKQDKIRNYYEYEECGYDEYNYDDDFKEELLRMLGEIE